MLFSDECIAFTMGAHSPNETSQLDLETHDNNRRMEPG